MVKFDFFRHLIFVKLYIVITIILLILTLIFNVIGFSIFSIQNIAGVLTLIVIPLMIGQILLIMSVANKSDKIGWIIVRLSYVTLFVACQGLLLITMGTFVISFDFGGQLISTVGLIILMTFDICFSVISYYILSIESAWLLKK